MDSTLHDQASLSNSDIETPGWRVMLQEYYYVCPDVLMCNIISCVCIYTYVGMHPTLNSVGGISPHRVRTMKDQELVRT